MDSSKLAMHWEGASSVSQTPFDEVNRALRLYAIVESNVQFLTNSFKTGKRKVERLRAEGYHEEARREYEALERALRELRELSLFQRHVSERFQAQAEHLQRIASDAYGVINPSTGDRFERRASDLHGKVAHTSRSPGS